LYSYNGAGPHKIVNNFIQAAAVNILYGGWDPVIPNLVTADVEIRGNLITKDLEWRGSEWMVKNLFELKNARRVLVDGNILEYSWAANQVGDAILIKSTNQANTGRPGCDWCLSEDVTIRNNIVRHVAGGLRLSGRDSGAPFGGQTSRIRIHNNLFYDIDKGNWGGGRNETGRTFTITEDFVDVQITNNTAIASLANDVRDISMQSTLGPVGSGLVIENNIITRTGEAVRGDGIVEGTATLEAYAPGYRFENNVIVGGLLSKSPYPANNFLLPEDLSVVQFVDPTANDFRLSESSPYRKSATDGRHLGADIEAIETATSCSLSGQCDTSQD